MSRAAGQAPAATRRTDRREGARARQARVRAILDRLAARYPDVATALHHDSPFQLLVATVLSAQTTDRMVNEVTPALFARFADPAALAAAPPGELEALIRPVNYHRTKGVHLRGLARMLVAEHGGEVPGTLAELVRLPGVGRKTANVVLGGAFGRAEGVVVDTHVRRLAGRLGLSRATDPPAVEQDLVALLPRDAWIATSHRLIFFGRDTCLARRPRCASCILVDLCPAAATARPAAVLVPSPSPREDPR